MSHTLPRNSFVAALILAGALSAHLIAQAPPPSPVQAASSQSLVQLRVQVTITRHIGDKKTASLPFTLWVTLAGDRTSLSTAQNILVPSVTFKEGSNTPAPSYQTRSVGTNIVCAAKPASDGRFIIDLTLSDSRLAPGTPDDGMATLKSLQTSNSLLLRDGQTAEFASSTDLITGEVTRIDVTATVIK